MRGDDIRQGAMFSYLSPEQRVPADHPLRPIRQMVDTVLKRLSPCFEGMYAEADGPRFPPRSSCAPWFCNASIRCAASVC